MKPLTDEEIVQDVLHRIYRGQAPGVPLGIPERDTALVAAGRAEGLRWAFEQRNSYGLINADRIADALDEALGSVHEPADACACSHRFDEHDPRCAMEGCSCAEFIRARLREIEEK